MSRQPKLSNLAAMVAVAAGTIATVNRWAAVLSRASIPATVVECCESDPFLPYYAELWVRRRDADDAHAALWCVRPPAGTPGRRTTPAPGRRGFNTTC